MAPVETQPGALLGAVASTCFVAFRSALNPTGAVRYCASPPRTIAALTSAVSASKIAHELQSDHVPYISARAGGDAAFDLGLTRAQVAKEVAVFWAVEAILEMRKAPLQCIEAIRQRIEGSDLGHDSGMVQA